MNIFGWSQQILTDW